MATRSQVKAKKVAAKKKAATMDAGNGFRIGATTVTGSLTGKKKRAASGRGVTAKKAAARRRAS